MANASIHLNITSLDSHDRSFFYGDGCFTTMYADNHKIFLLEQHLARLSSDSSKLYISIDNWPELQERLETLLINITSPHVVKVLVSRGVGGRGYSPKACDSPSIYIYTYPIALNNCDLNKSALSVGIADIALADQAQLAGLKHNSRLEQVLAKQELLSMHDDGLTFDDLLLLDTSQHVIEASSANIFYQLNDIWYTPQLNKQGVAGVMRDFVMDTMKAAGIECQLTLHHIDELKRVNAAFICNAVQLIQPLKSVCINSQEHEISETASRDIFKLILDALFRV